MHYNEVSHKTGKKQTDNDHANPSWLFNVIDQQDEPVDESQGYQIE